MPRSGYELIHATGGDEMSKSKGRDLESFRAAHDKSFIVPKRIRDGLTALGDSWEYEVEFIKRCQLDTTGFAAYREQFKEFYVELGGRTPKRVWAGTKAFAAKLRERIA